MRLTGFENEPNNPNKNRRSAPRNQEAASEGVDLSQMATKKRRKKQRNKKRIAINCVAVLVIIGSLFSMGFSYVMDSRLFTRGQEETGNFEPTLTSASQDVTYFMIAGTHKGLTDTLMVACLDTKENKCSILQIPRDTYVSSEDTNNHGHKINAVYAHPRAGENPANALIRRINTNFALPVDHYIVVDMPAFPKIVDALGGIEVDVKKRIVYPGCGPIEVGLQTLNGEQAELFMRARKGGDYVLGDPDRVMAQRQFYMGLAKKMMEMSLSQMASLVNVLKDDVTTDMSVGEIMDYAQAVKQLTMDDMSIYAIPGESYDPGKGTANWISYYTVHRKALLELLTEKFNPYGVPIQLENLKIPERQNSGYETFDNGGSFSELSGGQ